MSDQNSTDRDPKLIAAAILVGLVLIAGVILIGARLLGGEDPESRRPSGPTSNTAKQSSTCGLPDSQTMPTAAPKTRWYFIGAIAAPEAPGVGPAKKANGLATCFARSPEGALFAAATLIAETFPDDDTAELAARARMVPNEAREAALAAPAKTDRFPSQVVGYKFVDYTPDRASLSIASRLTAGPQAGGIGALTMTMVWREGDWWWELQPSTSATAIASLDGFTKWSAVS